MPIGIRTNVNFYQYEKSIKFFVCPLFVVLLRRQGRGRG